MKKSPVILLAILIFFLSSDPTYKISGKALDFFTGKEIEGNVTAIIVETGEKNITSLKGNFEIILSSLLNHFDNKFSLTIIANSSDKIGFSQLEIGYGNKAPQQAECEVKKYYFKGLALSENGSALSGKITVFVKDRENSTSFSNGVWEIEVYPCLIPGEIANFKFFLDSNESKGFFSIYLPGKV